VTIRGPFAVVMLVLLFVSLATNLVVAGFAFGRFAGMGPGGPNVDRILALGLRDFPPEIQRNVMQRLRQQRDVLRDRVRAIQDARRNAFELMRADPFDRASLDQAFADVRAKTGEVQAFGQQMLSEAVGEAPADFRKQIRPPRGTGP
jgi:uncharacterized membrane protein